jgi:hypothetical protein
MRVPSHPAAFGIAVLSALLLAWPTASAAQEARRQFVTVAYSWLYTQPLQFAEHPLEDLIGADVAAAQGRAHDYETRDGLTRVFVDEYRRGGRGAAVTVYPFGLRRGATLGLRGSIEDLPVIRLTFEGAPPLGRYLLTDGRAYDASVGVFVADRSPGWGLGSHVFVAAGVGGIRSGLGDGRRYVGEAGGGMSSGPIGVELSVKFAWNRLSEPVSHGFLTVPITLRAAVSF